MRSHSASEPKSGFSQITCLPASMPRRLSSKCVAGGVQMSTMSMSSRAKSAAASCVYSGIANSLVSRSPRSSSSEQRTGTSKSSGSQRNPARWRSAMPAPTTATRYLRGISAA